MSDVLIKINCGLSVWVDYDYDSKESTVVINAVYGNDVNCLDALNTRVIEEIEQNIFDSFDKELQEPDYEYVEG